MNNDIDIRDIPVQESINVITTITSWIGLVLEDVAIYNDNGLVDLYTNVQIVTHTNTIDNEILGRFVVVLN